MSGTAAPPAVRLEAVSKRFGDHTAVETLSLAIAAGEFFSLLGPSGCGKTTTLRIVAGFEAPSAGRVFLHGVDITERPAHLRQIGMVFQHYALFPHLSVFENVAFPLRLRRTKEEEIRQRVSRALETVRLPGLAARMPAQLSGGQQQRVALARALVFQPGVVLLDEPLGALDLKLRKAMQLELKTLQRETGLTFVYVTHDQEEALTMSDRIAVMDRGQVLQVDDPRAIYQRPASRFVADFIGVSNFLPGRVKEVGAAAATIELDGGALVRAERRADIAPGQAVTAAVRPERIRLDPWSADVAGGSGEGWNVLPGVVRELVYTGSDTQYLVELGGGGAITVMVRVPNDAPEERRPRVQRGDRVSLRWEMSGTTILVA
jgi:spermidine/putrescine transport system ATP-binding protein